jgi:hydroxyquinol 1,2-dioxygenase
VFRCCWTPSIIAYPEAPTRTTVLGPFYVQNPPEARDGADTSGATKGVPLYLEGSIRSLDGKPAANAFIDVWQPDAVVL